MNSSLDKKRFPVFWPSANQRVPEKAKIDDCLRVEQAMLTNDIATVRVPVSVYFTSSMSFCLSFCPSVRLSIYLSVRLSMRLMIHIHRSDRTTTSTR